MSRQSEERQERILASVYALIANPNFHDFLDMLRDMRENAVAYMTSHTAVKDQREHLAAVGEVRFADLIINTIEGRIEALRSEHEKTAQAMQDEQERQTG